MLRCPTTTARAPPNRTRIGCMCMQVIRKTPNRKDYSSGVGNGHRVSTQHSKKLSTLSKLRSVLLRVDCCEDARTLKCGFGVGWWRAWRAFSESNSKNSAAFMSDTHTPLRARAGSALMSARAASECLSRTYRKSAAQSEINAHFEFAFREGRSQFPCVRAFRETSTTTCFLNATYRVSVE